MRLRLREGSAAARSYHFRPKDPPWASATLMEEVRAELRRFDPLITVWWSEAKRMQSHPDRPGRWRVMEFLPRVRNWSEFCTWEGPEHSYRPPWPVSAIVKRLGYAKERMDSAARRVEAATERTRSAMKSEFYAAMDEWAQDQAERAVGTKSTQRRHHQNTDVTTDGLRRRAAIGAGMMRGGDVKRQLTNHERFLIDHFKKQLGVA